MSRVLVRVGAGHEQCGRWFESVLLLGLRMGVERMNAGLKHGRAKSYRKGCRCQECRLAISDYEMARSADRAKGIYWMVDPTRAIEHVQRLKYDRCEITDIASASGIAASTIRGFMRGKVRKIKLNTEEAILGVSAEDAGTVRMYASYERRRLEQFFSAGFTPREVARAMGLSVRTLQNIRHGGVKRISNRTKVKLYSVTCEEMLREAEHV